MNTDVYSINGNTVALRYQNIIYMQKLLIIPIRTKLETTLEI